MDLKKKWLIRETSGLESGPFSTVEVLTLIQQQSLMGEEEIRLDSEVRWRPMSTEEVFYSALLQSLSCTDSDLIEEISHSDEMSSFDQDATQIIGDVEEEEQPKGEKVYSARALSGGASSEDRPSKKIEALSPEASSSKIQANKTEPRRAKRPLYTKEARKKPKFKSKRFVLLLIVIGLLGGLAVVSLGIQSEDKRKTPQSLLTTPSFKGAPLTKAQLEKNLKKGLQSYLRGGFSNYELSAELFLSVVNSHPERGDALAALCLVYYELLSYGLRTHKEEKVFSILAQKSSLLGARERQFAVEAKICQIIDLLVRGKSKRADRAIINILESSGAKIHPTLFYLKAAILSVNSQNLEALNYLWSVQKSRPKWTQPYILESQIHEALGDPSRAMRRYRSVLKLSPNNFFAKVQLAGLESRLLKHLNVAEKLLNSVVAEKTRVSSKTLAEAHYGLAEIYLEKKNGAKAKKHLKKAFYTFPLAKSQTLSKTLGLEFDKDSIVDSSPYILDGDRLALEGDYRGAEALYKTAYELSPSALAALKAGKASRALGLGSEAVEWFRKATQQDSEYVEAYVYLADLYSERYDFFSASSVLKEALAKNKNNYEVYIGFALFEYRRRNYQATIQYALQAVKMYSIDPRPYVLLTKAYLSLGEYDKALANISSAISIDPSNYEAEAYYIKVIALIQGLDLAAKRANESSEQYPRTPAFRLALAESYYKQDYFEKSIEILESLISSGLKSDKDVYYQYGLSLKAVGDAKGSYKAFSKSAALDLSDVKALFQSGVLFYETKKYESAINQLKKVQEYNSFYPETDYYIGLSYLELARRSPKKSAEREEFLDKAEFYAGKEKEKSPKIKTSHILLARIHELNGNYKACAASYQVAVQLGSIGSNLYVSASRCYRKGGNFEAAIALLNEARRRETGNPYIYLELGRLSEDKSNWRAALESYQKFLSLQPIGTDATRVSQRVREIQNKIGGP